MRVPTIALATGAQLRYASQWLPWPAAAIAAGYAVIGLSVATVGTLETSLWDSAGWVLQWLAFVAGLVLGSSLPVLVAHGLARRTVTAASVLAMLALALAMAAAVQAGLLLERLAYRLAGLPYQVDDPHLFGEVAQVHLVLVEFTLMFAGFLASGWLILTSYYRLGWLRGTFALPLCAVPAVGAQAALAAGWIGDLGPGTPSWVGSESIALSVALSLAAVAAGLLGVPLLARTVSIKPRTV